MAPILIIIALIVLVGLFRGQSELVWQTLESDLSSRNAVSILAFAVVMMVLSAIAEIDALSPLAVAFMLLILLAFIIRNASFFSDLMSQIQS